MNPTLELIERRFSTRTFSEAPITDAEKSAILHAAMRAPTAGNMMLYSIVEVTDQALKDRLAETCDDQPFIAKAPWALVFLADMQKWMDLFDASGAYELPGIEHRRVPGPGDLLLACCDALIAAQNAVLAAESLGIGSCYIGDILENAETHAELMDLPQHVLPITMLVFGRPRTDHAPRARYERHVVHENRYRRLTPDELAETTAELGELHGSNRFPPGTVNEPQAVYARKFTSDFMAEMNRSVGWWIERWCSPEGAQ